MFNHRNNFDVFMVAALVRDNWTGVAKIELERNPLVGPLGKLMDTAFIDRADSAAAVAALKGVEEAARKGLSIVIAPEGSRMDAQAVGPLSVGPFKKGAFRIAMATGLPIVPIVIRNSDSVACRNTYRLNPGTVDIAVLPPIDVGDWTHEELPKLIEQVRTRYLETLADWPVAGPGRRRPGATARCGARRRPMSGESDLAGLLADGTDTVLLTQASTPTEARLIRQRIAASGGTGRPPVSLGPSGSRPAGLPESLLDGEDAVRLVPVRVAWLPEEHAGSPCREARRHHARARPVSPQRTSAAADPGPPAGPRRRAPRRARDGRLAAAALGRGYRRQ